MHGPPSKSAFDNKSKIPLSLFPWAKELQFFFIVTSIEKYVKMHFLSSKNFSVLIRLGLELSY